MFVTNKMHNRQTGSLEQVLSLRSQSVTAAVVIPLLREGEGGVLCRERQVHAT
ncbi:hypothetical protein P7K49_026080 [Saguinus oedipus]|uniref:Uncharacterized protein n=1 Tax=Saguinus oedipus TaxID=9490 RepID=A0ABQ9UJ03_SAGOE|nr:hypothetical protein P7K49_026080 [Saguinus oedipus]